MKKLFYIFYMLQGMAGVFLLAYYAMKRSEPVFGSPLQSDIWMERAVIIGFFLIMLISQYIFYFISKEKMKQELKMKDQLYRAQKQYYQLLLEREHDTKKIRHDMRNHMMCLHELLCQEHYEKGQQYVEACMEQLKQLDYVIHTGNDILDIIVNDIYSRYAVWIDFQGRFPEKTMISDVDLCILFSNILSNAAESAENTNDSRIFMLIERIKNAVKIEIKNRVSEEPQWKMQRIPTSKKDKNRHGFGMENVEDVVKKYHGTIFYEYQKAYFSVTILFVNVLNDHLS